VACAGAAARNQQFSCKQLLLLLIVINLALKHMQVKLHAAGFLQQQPLLAAVVHLLASCHHNHAHWSWLPHQTTTAASQHVHYMPSVQL
jgi:hypothetical protein